MTENKAFEAVASLILRSISVWEDMHLYALTYSTEYHTFWGLLDINLKAEVHRYSKQNRQERRLPFSMSLADSYRYLLTPDSYARIRDQYWKKQLKAILTDQKFRMVMESLNERLDIKHPQQSRTIDRHVAANNAEPQFCLRVG